MEQTTTVLLTLLFLLLFALFYALGYTEKSFNCRLYPIEIKKAIIILKGTTIAGIIDSWNNLNPLFKFTLDPFPVLAIYLHVCPFLH